MKTVFAGTPDFAVPTLVALIRSRHDVCLVVTPPDRRGGRGRKKLSPPVKQLAQSRGVPVIQTKSINRSEVCRRIESEAPDALVVVAYGKRLTPRVLGIPRLGCFNVHASRLPKYRGAAPVAHAILNGETETGVTLQRMASAIDTGPIVAQRSVYIYEDEAAGELEERLAIVAADLVPAALDAVENGTAVERDQVPGRVSLAPRLRKLDGLIDWDRPASAVCNLIRAMTPWPGAFTFRRPTDGGGPQRVIILAARPFQEEPKTRHQRKEPPRQPGEVVSTHGNLIVATGEGLLSVLRVKPGGGKPMDAAAYLCGHAVRKGDRFHGRP